MDEAAKANTITLEEFLEVERHKLGSNLTPVNKETFAKWKRTRMDKKEAEQETVRKSKDARFAAGKSSGMSGRDLVSCRIVPAFRIPATRHSSLTILNGSSKKMVTRRKIGTSASIVTTRRWMNSMRLLRKVLTVPKPASRI